MLARDRAAERPLDLFREADVLLLDPEGAIRDASRAIGGLDRGALRGLPLARLVATRDQGRLGVAVQTALAGRPVSVDVLLAAGTAARVHLVPSRSGAIAVLNDDQPAWQDPHRVVIADAPLGIAVLDGPIVREANPALLRLTGRTRDEVEGRPLDALFADGDAVEAARQHAAGGRLERVDARLANGRWVSLTLRAAGGSAVAMLEDAAPAREAADLQRRVAELETLSEQRARMLHVAGHELRNPLTPMLLQLSVLRLRPDLTPETADLLERVERQGLRVKTLVAGLLDYARLEEGQLRLEREDLCAQELARDVIEAFGASAQEWGLELSVDAEPVRFSGDRVRLEQVLWNLVGNALKFTPRGGRVVVRARVDGDDVLFEVEDGGPGVPQARREEVFAPFARAEGGAGREEGTGMGLPVARALVAAHGGAIGIRDAAAGSVFWFRLRRHA